MVVPATMRLIIFHEVFVNKLAPNIGTSINGRVVQVVCIQWTSELVIVVLLLLLEIRTLMMYVLLLALFPSVTANVVTGLCLPQKKYGIIFEMCSSCRRKKKLNRAGLSDSNKRERHGNKRPHIFF